MAQYNYGVASIFNLKGLVSEKKGEYQESITNYLESSEYASKTQNLYAVSNPLHNIGLLYEKMKDYPKALTYFEQALSVRKKIGNQSFIGQSYLSIASMCNYLKKDSLCVFYSQEAIQIFQQEGDVYNLSLTQNNLGQHYAERGDFKRADELYQQVVNSIDPEVYPENYVLTAINLVNMKNQLGDFRSALEVGERGLAIARRKDLKVEEELILLELADTYYSLKNLDKTYWTQRRLMELSDSLLNADNLGQITELETKYRVKEKEATLAQQELVITRQDQDIRNNWLMIFGLCILLIASFLIAMLWRSRIRKKQQLALQQKELAMRQAQLQAFIDSQEQERKRFATDLHDGFGQLITLLKMNVNAVRNTEDDLIKRGELFDKSTEILDGMYNELRGICFNLMPHTLVKNGLVQAIKELVARLNQSGKVMVDFMPFGPDERFNELTEISIYRIVQEWINNILKYGEAQNINVQLTADEGELTLTIEDDGPGFDTQLLINGNGNGWKNMTSRTNLVKGELDVDSRPGGRGTTLFLNIPMQHVKTEVGQEVSAGTE